MSRPAVLPRLRVVLLAVALTVTGLGLEAAPVARPTGPAGGGDPLGPVLPFGLGPAAVQAAYCANSPNLTGKLTQQLVDSGTPSTAGRITSATVYGWIGNVVAGWGCTLYRRYSGLAWNTTATRGKLQWGTIINSTGVACDWAVGSTDYLKANDTGTCPATDTGQHMTNGLSAERVYQPDAGHNTEGDFSFAHADCATTPYYGSYVPKGGEGSGAVDFGSAGDNRPGNNCDAPVYDATGTSQTVTYDATPPQAGFTAPAAGGPAVVPSASYTVAFTPSDNVAGIGPSGWSLQRQTTAWSGTACGTGWTGDGAPVTGTATTAQLVGQSLSMGACYRWIFSATDLNGNAAAEASGTIRTDTGGVLGLQGHLRTESWDLGAGDSLAVSVGSGNVVLRHPVLALPIRGGSLGITLAYNSQDATDTGFGPGWRTNLDRRLLSPAWGSDITFTDGDGSRHTFTWSQATSSYTRPATVYATLAQQGSGFRLTYRDGAYDVFTSGGLLAEERDRLGNGVTLDRTVADQVSVVDAAGGRSVVLAYSQGHVTSITDWVYVSGGIVQPTATGSRRVTRLFYDAGANLAGWADPLNTTGSCPTGGSHVTCLSYGNGRVTAIAKTQTYTTLTSGVLGAATHSPATNDAVTTTIAYAGADVTSVTDAEGGQTLFTHPAVGATEVVRPGTPASTTRYTLASPTDTLGRITSVRRLLGTATWIEERTVYDTTYPVEPASVTENRVDGTPSDAMPDEDRTTSYTYVASSMGLIARVTEPLTASTHRTTDHTYNANNDVTQTITALDGSTTGRTVTRYCYDASCTLSGTGPSLLKRIENFTDGTAGGASGNVEDVTTSYQYDAYGQRTRETRANYRAGDPTPIDQAATGWTYDTYGNQTSEIRNYTDGTVTSPGSDVTPSADGARTDLTTTYGYDTAGNRVSTADPRRAVEAARGTSLGPDDFTGRATFDALGRQRTEATPTTPGVVIGQETATTIFDELGNVREAVDFGGVVTATESDRTGHPTRTFEDVDGDGGAGAAVVSAGTYDASGRPLTTADRRQVADAAHLGATVTTYDELGRPETVTEGGDVVPGDGIIPPGSVTVTLYDDLGRTAVETVGGLQATTYAYDLGGRTLRTDDEFACTTRTFDHRDLALTETSGLAGGTCANGTDTRTVTSTYDGLGRRTRSEVTAGTGTGDRTMDATIDGAGRILTAATRTAGVTATTTSTFSPLDELVAETRPDGSVTKTAYDAAGNPADRCTWSGDPGAGVLCLPVGQAITPAPAVRSTTTYDARNNRLSLADGATSTTTEYNPDHNYLPKAFYVPTAAGKEFQTLYEYDSRHRLTGVTHQVCTISTGHSCSSTVAVGSDTYAYDDSDNRTQVVESNGATSSDRRYCHDGLNRLRARNTGSACTTTTGDETYKYDDAGNRLTAPGTTATYDGAGQLTACTGCGTVDHDSAGQTTALAGWTYEYDAEGRLTTATETATGDRLEMAYDAAGHRTQLREYTAGVLTRTRDLRYQGDAIVEESVAGTVVRSYSVTDAGQVVSMTIPAGQSSAGVYLPTWNGHGDALALWRMESDGTLTLANSYTYSTWGRPTTATHNGIPDLGFRFLYVGASDVQWDDFSGAGLQYMHARHYSPLTGRFLQPDPSAAEANLYAYAGDSPVTKADACGLLNFAVGKCGVTIIRAEFVNRMVQISVVALSFHGPIIQAAGEVQVSIGGRNANLAIARELVVPLPVWTKGIKFRPPAVGLYRVRLTQFLAWPLGLAPFGICTLPAGQWPTDWVWVGRI